MIQVINNQVVKVGLPTTGEVNGQTVSGYDLLPLDVLTAEGWLPSENNIPVYDSATQELEVGSYTIQSDKVIVNYVAVTKTPSELDRISASEDAIVFLLG